MAKAARSSARKKPAASRTTSKSSASRTTASKRRNTKKEAAPKPAVEAVEEVVTDSKSEVPENAAPVLEAAPKDQVEPAASAKPQLADGPIVESEQPQLQAASAQPAPQTAKPLRTLGFGEAVPLAYSQTRSNPKFAFGSLGGRYTLLGFLPAESHPEFVVMLHAMQRAKTIFHAAKRVVAIATAMEGSRQHPTITALDGSILVFHDQERGLHDTFGATGANRPATPNNMPHGWFLIDPVMRVMASFPPSATDQALNVLQALPEPVAHAGMPTPAPVMVVPRVFEPDFCQTLMTYYKERGGEASGVTRERDGKTLVELDSSSKKRFDCMIEDEALRKAAMHRVYWRLAPQIEKAFQFKVTRMERYIVCCYDAQSGGYFKAHRDNTTKGTAHRRFAVSINLNSEEFSGGGVTFPEYSKAVYNPPTGGALVFSCSILHEALPIAEGQRFAFLPFLYDDAAAEVRRANNQFLDESVGTYSG